jgi:hypothetical protein
MIPRHLLINLAIDLVAVLIFAGGFYFQRHKRRDLFVTFTFFNIAMFVIVTLITNSEIGIGASFGLFALLAIIRLRNEEFSNYEIGYFFGCLTLAIINGLGGKDYELILFLDAVIIMSMGLLDHPRILRNVQHMQVSLDAIYTNDAKLKRQLEKLLDAKILRYSVTKIDNVRDITSVTVDYQKMPLIAKTKHG